jgi:hypothetical protein
MNMKRVSVVMALLTSAMVCGMAACASAEVVAVGDGETVEVKVGTGDTLASDGASVAPEGRVFKTGGGEWSLPANGVVQPNAAKFSVLDGKAVYQANGGTPAMPSVPDFVASRATAWIDASAYADHPELFTCASSNDTTYVDACYDVRETSVASPVYPCLKANVYTNFCGFSPELKDLNGKKAFWFGGYTSGRFFDWIVSGSVSSVSWKQMFIVHRVESSFGFIASTSLHISDYGNVAGGHYNNRTWDYTLNFTHVYQNGEPFDGFVNAMPSGTHVLDVCAISTGSFDAIFRDRGFFDSSAGYRAGGDWLCEVIIFPTELTESERLELTAYLNAKWKGVSAADVAYAIRNGATVEVNATANSGVKVSVSGRGSVVKTGSGVPAVDTVADFDGTFTPDAVGTEMRGALAVAPAGGVKTTSGATSSDIVFKNEAYGSADTWTKAGEAGAFISKVPASVKQVKVAAGTLTVWPEVASEKLSGGESVEVTIPNAGFESWDTSDVENGVFEKQLSPDAAYNGWYSTKNYVTVFDYSRWPATEKGTEATRNQFGLCAPPEGNCALFMHHALGVGTWGEKEGIAAWTFVDIPATGEYEFSCRVSGRGTSAFLGSPADILLIDESSSPYVTNRLGRIRYLKVGSYNRIFLRGKVVSAGTHKLRIQSLSTIDRALCVDDLRLRRVADCGDNAFVEAVPGGDFEDAYFDAVAANCASYSTTNTMNGWTFTQTEGTTGPVVGVTTEAIGNYSFYNSNRFGRGGFVQLCFYGATGRPVNGATASTTFTPSAGTWRVRADIAHRSYESGISATVEIGGGATYLGTETVNNHNFGQYRWPTSFTVDGTHPVTLTFTCVTSASSTGVWLDDICLESAASPDEEFIVNGDFEKQQSNGFSPASFTCLSRTGNLQCNAYGTATGAFGTDEVSDVKYLLMGNKSGVAQTVTLPAAGTYRLAYYAHSRIGAGYNGNILRVWIADSGNVTNEIGRTRYWNTKFTRTTYLFTVPVAGSYMIGLEGCLTTGSWAPAYETLVDGLSLRPVRGASAEPPFHKDTVLDVAAGARVNLGFTGTNRISRLRLGGATVYGVVDASTHPDYIAGQGALESILSGTTVVVR